MLVYQIFFIVVICSKTRIRTPRQIRCHMYLQTLPQACGWEHYYADAYVNYASWDDSRD